VRATQEKYGAGVVSDALDRFFGRIARAAVDRGVTRLVVGGGESSGAVVSALGLSCLAVGDEITAGVPVLYAKGPRPLALALKSGNFGEDDFFARALSRMASG
jgi:uncharacterized protein YgbK (DUF1537 family)